MESDLNSLQQWSAQWLHNFNILKCTTLHFGHGNPNHVYQLANQDLSNTAKEKDLVIQICSDLKPSSQVTNTIRKAERSLAILKRTVVNRGSVFVKLYKQLVRSYLEYATQVWNPYFRRDIQLLEQVQKRATKCVAGMKKKLL